MRRNRTQLAEQISFGHPNNMKTSAAFLLLAGGASASNRSSEVWTAEQERAAGLTFEDATVSSAHEQFVGDAALPDELNWCDKDGVNYCTMSRNQHIPQ